MPPRSRKAVKTSDTDLPANCKYKMSWRDSKNNKVVLLATSDQGDVGTCWTIVFNGLIAAHLYIHGKVRMLPILSRRHLFANIREKFDDGFIKHFRGLKDFLKDEGLVLNEECKCVVGKTVLNSVACDKVKNKKVFKIRELIIKEEKEVNEQEILTLLQTRGPIAASIVVDWKYKEPSKEDVIYYGPTTTRKLENHLIMITGCGTRDGIHYFEFQNSWGTKWSSDSGYGKLARRISLPKGQPSLIKQYMYPELLEEVLDA